MPTIPSVGDPGTDTVAPPNDWASKLNAALAVSLQTTGAPVNPFPTPTGGGVTLLVAASNASARVKAQADYLCDGTADNVEIAAALAALSTGKGTVQLSEGLFTIATAVAVPTNATVKGAGRTATTVKLANGATTSIFTSTTTTDVKVCDLTVDGNRANVSATSTAGVLFSGVTNGVIENVTATECDDDGIVAKSTSNVLTIRGCHVYNCDLRGIWINASFRVHIRDNHCHNNTLDGIDIDAFSELVAITGNTCYANIRNGIFVEEGFTGVVVSGNTCYQNTESGVAINQQTGFTARGCAVTGNHVRRNGQHGIKAVANAASGIVRDITIVGNTSNDNGTSASTTYDGIYVAANSTCTITEVVVQGNNVSDRQGSPTQRYGVNVPAAGGTITGIFVDANTGGGNVTALTNTGAGVTAAPQSAFNVAPAARTSAFTQTYATADKTLATPTSATLTNANGTGSTTIADVGAAFSQTTLNNIIRSLSDQINALRVDLLDNHQFTNSVVDDLQTYGWFS